MRTAGGRRTRDCAPIDARAAVAALALLAGGCTALLGVTDVTEAVDPGDGGGGPGMSGDASAADGTTAGGGDAGADSTTNRSADAAFDSTRGNGAEAAVGSADGEAGQAAAPEAGDRGGPLEGTESGTALSEGDSGYGQASLDGGVDDCGVPTLGGIPLANDYASSGAGVPGSGGFAYAYSDSNMPPGTGTSTSCIDANAFCGKIATGAMTTTGAWGAGIGVNLNQQRSATAAGSFAATGSGISYILSALSPQGMRIFIDNAGADYCADLTSAAGTVSWSAFNAICWQPDAGAGLAGPPTRATHINFQVSSIAAPGAPFSFCVVSLTFAP